MHEYRNREMNSQTKNRIVKKKHTFGDTPTIFLHFFLW